MINIDDLDNLKKKIADLFLAGDDYKGFLGLTDESPRNERHAAVDSLLCFAGAVMIGICGRIGACISTSPARPAPSSRGIG